MQLSKILPIFIFTFFQYHVAAQNTLITDDPGAKVESSAVLNVDSDTKGLLIPRLTKTARVTMSSPATGLIVFDITLGSFHFFNGTDWVELQSGELDAVLTYHATQNTISNSEHLSADFILGREDLPGTAAVSGQMLFYDNDMGALRGGNLTNSDDWAPDSIGLFSFAYGRNVKASSFSSVAIGDAAVASGYGSIAIGGSTEANGGFSMAVGGFTNATANFSTAMGSFTEASGENSTAMGSSTDATGENSTAMGSFTEASGENSTAMGSSTDATGENSTAMGKNTNADALSSTAIGQYNEGGGSPDLWIETDPLFEVGNGFSNSSSNNALTILKNGDFILNGHELPSTSSITDTLLFFDQSKGALRGGRLNASNFWSPDSLGRFSFAYGENVKALGVNSIALGARSEGRGENSISIGLETRAIGASSVAMGFFTDATGDRSTAIGMQTDASGTSSTAMGFFTDANGEYSTSLGNATKADAQVSTALGRYNIGGGDPDTWVGTDPLLEIGNGGFSERANALTILKNGDFILDGHELPSTSSITDTLLFFDQSKGALRGGRLLGSNAWSPDSIGVASFAYGENVRALGDYSTAMGRSTEAAGENSMSLGENTKADALSSIALGRYNVGGGSPDAWRSDEALLEVGNGSSDNFRRNALTLLKNGDFIIDDHQLPGSDFADGTLIFYDRSKSAFRGGRLNFSNSWQPDSIGVSSFAYGENVRASGKRSLAVGSNNVASGENSVALGGFTSARGQHAFSMGRFTTSDGASATSIGVSNRATGDISVALGSTTEAMGDYSTAMGRNTKAIGESSTAIGYLTQANGTNSTSLGNGSIADAQVSTALGQYNVGGGSPNSWVETDPLFEVGIGQDVDSRENAFTILKNGKIGVRTHSPEALMHLFHDSGSTDPHLILEEDGLDTDYTRIRHTNSTQSEYWTVAGRPDDDNTSLARYNINYSDRGDIVSVYGNGNMRMAHGALMFGNITSPSHRIQLPNSALPIDGEAEAFAWNTYSDARVKTNIYRTRYGLKEVLALNPVTYLHHSSEFNDNQLTVKDKEYVKSIGFIAQEVYDVLKEVVKKPENEDVELWSMDYEKLTPVLVRAIQEQQSKIEELEKKLDDALLMFSQLKADLK